MDSSPTQPSALIPTTWETLRSRLSESLETLELSASSDARITAMENFISMLSSCSDGSLSQEMSVFSMWMDITPILSEVTRLQQLAAGMQSRKETLWEEDSTLTALELRWVLMAESGIQYAWRRLEMSFLRHARVWLRGHFAVPLRHSLVMRTGSTERWSSRTDHLKDYNSTRADFLSALSGFRETYWGIEEVSEPPPLRVPLGNHGGVFRGPSAALSPFGTHADSCRTKAKPHPVGRYPSRQDSVGPFIRQPCLLWRPILSG